MLERNYNRDNERNTQEDSRIVWSRIRQATITPVISSHSATPRKPQTQVISFSEEDYQCRPKIRPGTNEVSHSCSRDICTSPPIPQREVVTPPVMQTNLDVPSTLRS